MNDKKKSTVIGNATFEYNENGQLESAAFHPKIKVSKEEIENQLGDCVGKSLDDIKKCAQLLLGAFFSKVSDIELRDMETTSIETEVVKGERYDDGKLKEIEFEFIYKH